MIDKSKTSQKPQVSLLEEIIKWVWLAVVAVMFVRFTTAFIGFGIPKILAKLSQTFQDGFSFHWLSFGWRDLTVFIAVFVIGSLVSVIQHSREKES